MKAVVLKGRTDGYEIKIAPTAEFKTVVVELEELLAHLAQENRTKDEILTFQITTGQRLFLPEENQQIEAVFAKYDNLKIHKISADVIRKEDALEFIEKRNIKLNGDTVRNGQVLDLQGDILFVGQVHQGGLLRTTGSLYILGKIEGIVHAGFSDNSAAVIIGELGSAQQIRIADLVEIVADHPQENCAKKQVIYVSDLHSFERTEISELRTLRPKSFVTIGALTF